MRAAIVDRADFDSVDRIKDASNQRGEGVDTILAGDHRLWMLSEPLGIEVDGRYHKIPAGFVADGSSIPSWAKDVSRWDLWEPPQCWAVIAHDWLYRERGTVKEYADKAFRELLRSEGCSWWKSEVVHLAAVVGGQSAYRSGQIAGPRISRSVPGPT